VAESRALSKLCRRRVLPLVSCSRLRRKVRLSSTFPIDAIIVSAPEIPAAASIITVSNLIKQFGRFVALREVNAEFAAGKLYVILGDNGAGKTTLLRALAGLAQPTRGEVSILGKNPREACRDVGYMAHPSLLYDEMSGLENLRYFARLYDIAGDSRCEQVIRLVRLDPELTRPVGQYSQGMRQRMSLARAILHDPGILFLDEPFSNVDVRSAGEMVELLTSMRDAGKTIFVVTHQASLLESAADEFVWMQAGQIVDRTAGLTQGPSRAGTE
jgi:ABC-type multidrug transport system ATPase subunit